ncbi:MAG: response regulator [Pirellulaceae bacterium]
MKPHFQSSSDVAPPNCFDDASHFVGSRILIVDDNLDATISLGRLLGLMGNEVRVAHDGADALTEMQRFEPQVVLLDLGLPEMDGFEVARRIRARPEWDDVALVALTGWGHEKYRQRTRQAGFTAHLLKPVKMEVLEATLQQVIAGQQVGAGVVIS